MNGTTDDHDGGPAGGPMRVDELAARSGIPVRTIREYQTWKVLHPPERVGRVGLYDGSHLRRLGDIARLQDRGYSIAAIRELFAAWEQGAGLRDVLGADDTLAAPADEAPLELTEEQLVDVVPAIGGSVRLLRRAERIGLLTRIGDRWVARSPALLQLTADAIEAGLPPTSALQLAEVVVRAAAEIGTRAGATVAEAVAADPERAEPLARRGRVLLARAVATHTIDQVGRDLSRRAADDPHLRALVDGVRIGTVTRHPGDARKGGAT